MTDEIDARFWPKVDIREPDACWEWLACIKNTGYGQFWTGERTAYAHRVMYEQARGPIPAGYHIDHLCRNPACVNPRHLEPVTNRENVLRGISPAAINATKTHCKHGHEFTPETIYLYRGKRNCRVCKNIASQKYRARKGMP